MIECLRTENAVLKEKLGKKRILLNDDQRRRLAVKGKILGRKVLDKVGTLFTPATILCWYRKLVARKWNYSDRKKRQGRPCFRQVIVIWFCSLPSGIRAGAAIGFRANSPESATTSATPPSPIPWNRPGTRPQTNGLVGDVSEITLGRPGCDRFYSVEVWTRHGLVTFYLLYVVELKNRRVHFAGCTTSPDESWVKQTARELTNHEDGFLNGKEHLIMDRDVKFRSRFDHS